MTYLFITFWGLIGVIHLLLAIPKIRKYARSVFGNNSYGLQAALPCGHYIFIATIYLIIALLFLILKVIGKI